MHSKKKIWTHKSHLVALTPLTLMNGLLQIGMKIDSSNMSYYLDIWKEYSTASNYYYLLLNIYILDPSIKENRNCSSSIKIVLLELAKTDRTVIINSIVIRLTFAYWFHETLEGRLLSNEKKAKQTEKDSKESCLTQNESNLIIKIFLNQST